MPAASSTGRGGFHHGAIDAAGVPTYPRIVQGSEEVATVLATCEYVRELTFTPAMRDGQPIAAIWDLTVNYRLQ